MTRLSDAELLRQYHAGDRSAFEALVRRWEEPLVRIAYRITGDLQEAEEVRQTVLLRLIESPRTLREPERLAAWIRRVAVNTAITVVRSRRRRHEANARMGFEAPSEQHSQPGDAVAAAEEAERLRDALGQLPPVDRALVALRFDEGLTFKEIAAVLDRPESTVKSQAAKAIERLRKLLGAPVKPRGEK